MTRGVSKAEFEEKHGLDVRDFINRVRAVLRKEPLYDRAAPGEEEDSDDRSFGPFLSTDSQRVGVGTATRWK